MLFALLFLFAFSLCLPCCVVTEKVHQKRSADPCANAVNPANAAHTIYASVVAAIKRRKQGKELQYNQFAFLYVHGTSKQVVYNMKKVRDVLQGNEPLPYLQYTWPAKSKKPISCLV